MSLDILLVVVVFLLVSPLIAIAASYFHWLGEKREREALDREVEEFRRDCEARLGPEPAPPSTIERPNDQAGEELKSQPGSSGGYSQ